MKLTVVLLCLAILKFARCQNNTTEPLILTPLIKEGKFQEAQDAARVQLDELPDLESYAGYFTVNEQHNSNLYFWFFPSETDYANDPVILWLQGGPGASALVFGLFQETGPIVVNANMSFTKREYSWTQNNSVIFIDNPVGSGFSFTDDDDGYARNETVIGEQLYEALLQFFQMFPQLQTNPFFVSGESYAGKYIPAVSYVIFKKNQKAVQKINLQGLTIGNGFCDPVHQFDYSDYLYQIGLIDTNQKIKLKKIEQNGIEAMKKGEWLKSFHIIDDLILQWEKPTHFHNETGFMNYYNFLQWNQFQVFIPKIVPIIEYLLNDEFKSLIHVGNVSFAYNSSNVKRNLAESFTKSVAPLISELLSHYRVLIYNGQLDIIVAYPLTVNFLQHLDFNGAEEYKTASRHSWIIGEELAGYAKKAGNLTEVLVRNAGHMVPMDQPMFAFDLISKFTRNLSFW